MSPDNQKGTIIVTDEGTLSREMREALTDAKRAGVEVVFAGEHLTPASLPKLLTIEFPLHLRKPPCDALFVKSNRKTPNQPWYAKFRKDKR